MKKIILLLISIFISIKCADISNNTSLTFDIISSNVLDESLYQIFCKPQKSGIPYEKREISWLNALQDKEQFADTNIICFQEFNHNVQKASISILCQNDYINKIHHSNANPSTWVNKKLFEITEQIYFPFKTNGAQPNGFEITFIQNESGVIIGIINAHLKNDTPSNLSYDEFRVSQLNEILEQIKNYNKCQNWIICGDFNTDRKTHLHIMNDLKNEGFSDAFENQTATARSSQGHLKSIDYMWYKGKNINLLKKDIYPKEGNLAELLLTHRSDDLNKNYFSDHVILKAQFQLI